CTLSRYLFPPVPLSPLFPYTTLFRSDLAQAFRRGHVYPYSLVIGEPAGRRRPHFHACIEPIGGPSDPFVAHDVTSGNRGPVLPRSEEHTSELQSLRHLVCRLLLEKKK